MPKVLFVEDNVGILEFLNFLMEEGFPEHKVLTARSVKKALEALPEDLSTLSVVFTDGRLINSFGWDFARELRERGYEGGIIYFGNASLPKGASKLFDGFCEKIESKDIRQYIRMYTE